MVKGFQLSEVLENEQQPGVFSDVAHTFLQGYETAKGRGLIEEDERFYRWAMLFLAHHGVEGQTGKQPQERLISGKFLFWHDHIKRGDPFREAFQCEIRPAHNTRQWRIPSPKLCSFLHTGQHAGEFICIRHADEVIGGFPNSLSGVLGHVLQRLLQVFGAEHHKASEFGKCASVGFSMMRADQIHKEAG